MTTEIPAEFSEYDWLELLGFTRKIENEGYEYAAENYAPNFEAEALKRIAEDDDPRPLKKLVRGLGKTLEAWQEAVGWKAVSDLWDAHLREEKHRREAHLLWAVHPGGDWDYAPYSDAFASRELVDKWIAAHAVLVTKYGWKPWTGRILHRDVPGGEWTEVRPA